MGCVGAEAPMGGLCAELPGAGGGRRMWSVLAGQEASSCSYQQGQSSGDEDLLPQMFSIHFQAQQSSKFFLV